MKMTSFFRSPVFFCVRVCVRARACAHACMHAWMCARCFQEIVVGFTLQERPGILYITSTLIRNTIANTIFLRVKQMQIMALHHTLHLLKNINWFNCFLLQPPLNIHQPFSAFLRIKN